MTVQGFLATISINGADITASVENFELTESRVVNDKQTMNGSPDGVMILGTKSGTLSFDYLIDQEALNVLEAAWLLDVPVTFAIAVTEAGVTTNTLWSGKLAMSSFAKSTAGDGLWRGSLSGDTSGAITHTPFVA